MADVVPTTHLEKTIAGQVEPTTHLEKVIALYSGSGGSGGTTNYNLLSNKPSINGVELTGDRSLKDLKLLYETEITTASTTWSIQHNLGTKTPTLLLLDENNVPIGGEIDYKGATDNLITVNFCEPKQGKAIIKK